MAPAADIAIISTDSALVVQTWDGWLAAATGISSDRARGQHLSTLVPDISARGLWPRFEEALQSGTVQILAPAFHHYLIPCAPRAPSRRFDRMQQRVTIGPLLDGDTVVGLILTIEDVTAQLDAERDLADALASDDPARRLAASEAIAAAGRVESYESFRDVLGDEDWKVRRAAVHSLAGAADRDLIKSLLASLRREHRNFAVLSSALRLLAMSDVDATMPLTELLKDDDPDLRIQAALALGEQQDQTAAGPLMATLEDPDQNVRFHAIEALGRLRAHAAVDALAAIVESADFFLAFAALDALALIGDPRVVSRLAPLLANPQLRTPVADALGAIGDDETIEPLASALHESPDAAVAIVQALVSIHDRYERQFGEGSEISDLVGERLSSAAKQHVLDAVGDADQAQLPALVRLLGWLRGKEIQRALTRLLDHASVRGAVVEALVRHGEGVVDLVVEQLSSEDQPLRLAAINALGRLGSRRATPALVAAIEDQIEDPELIVASAGALARIGDERAFDILLRLVGHPNAAVRQGVIGALNSIGHADMPKRIGQLLDHDDPLVRESAVRIAGYFGYRETADQLLSRASDPAEPVRAAALEHLAFLDDPRAPVVLLDAMGRETPRARAAIAKALGRIEHPETLDALMSALHDQDLWVRYYAARAAGQQRSTKATARLAELASGDPVPHVRIAAIEALTAIDGLAAFEVLEASVNDADPEVSAAALRAIGTIPTAEALTILQDGLRSSDAQQRSAAVRGLIAHGSRAAVSSLEWTAAADAQAEISRVAIDGLQEVAGRETEGSTAAVDALIGLLGVAERREPALIAIGRLPVHRIDDVARGLDRSDPDVRLHVVAALGRFKRAEATRWLAEALTDEASAVREAAILGLMRLGARGMVSRFNELARTDPSKAVRRAAAAAVAHQRSSG